MPHSLDIWLLLHAGIKVIVFNLHFAYGISVHTAHACKTMGPLPDK